MVWARAVECGQLPVGKGITFTSDDTLRGKVIEKIMCTGAVNLDAVGADAGAIGGWYLPHGAELAKLRRMA